MNLSMKWLADYIDTGVSLKEFCDRMTISGSKVERYEIEGSEISNVVVGKVLEIEQHPDADKLVVCKIDIGNGETRQIVTGATNVVVGAQVPVALDGATLPNNVKIKKGKLRGVVSEGMMCGLEELGLTVNDFPYAIEDGIFLIEEECELGEDIHSAIGLNDEAVEFEITSNRPDCLAVLGLAREASATFDVPFTVPTPKFNGNGEKIADLLKVKTENTELCSRYIAGVVKNVKIGPSPRWIRERLRASGVRPINNLVDITNFVMLEYGHPMHAFDIRYIDNNEIVVRNAKNGEKITTLDGVERTLTEKMLVIADANKPVAVAGVMGGEYSGIMDDTTTVVFESACFDGASVRTTSKSLGMRTDASARFEKGIDPLNAYPAIIRAFELVELLGVGEVVSEIIDCDNTPKERKGVEFNPAQINKFLGTDLSEELMITNLNKLGFSVENGIAYPPSVRIDIECMNDLAEEISRIYDYNNIPKTLIKGVANASLTATQKFERKVVETMVSLGAYEICTYSFVSPKGFDKIRLPENSILRKAVTISNPLGEDTSVMRTSIIPSICEILSRNYNFRNASASLFELSNEYLPTTENELPTELSRLGFGIYGNNCDFFSVKGTIEELLEIMGVSDYEFTAIKSDEDYPEASAFHPGRTAVISKDGVSLGIIGELHPEVLENYEIGVKAYVCKLCIPEIMAISETEKKFKPLPKFPATTRDIAVVCDVNLPVASLEKAIKSAVGKILESVNLFDVYTGKQVEAGKKSVAYNITMRSHDATLTDEQASGAMKRVLKELAKLGAEIRS